MAAEAGRVAEEARDTAREELEALRRQAAEAAAAQRQLEVDLDASH